MEPSSIPSRFKALPTVVKIAVLVAVVLGVFLLISLVRSHGA